MEQLMDILTAYFLIYFYLFIFIYIYFDLFYLLAFLRNGSGNSLAIISFHSWICCQMRTGKYSISMFLDRLLFGCPWVDIERERRHRPCRPNPFWWNAICYWRWLMASFYFLYHIPFYIFLWKWKIAIVGTKQASPGYNSDELANMLIAYFIINHIYYTYLLTFLTYKK